MSQKLFTIICILALAAYTWMVVKIVEESILPVMEQVPIIQTVVKTDTTVIAKPVYIKGEAKIVYDTVDNTVHRVATYDTSANGFEAHLKYYTEKNYFDNRFVIPERIITNDITNTITNTETIIKEDFNKYEAAVGLDFNLIGNELKYKPFASANYNIKIFRSLVLENQFKLSITHKSSAFLFEPAVETQIKVGL